MYTTKSKSVVIMHFVIKVFILFITWIWAMCISTELPSIIAPKLNLTVFCFLLALCVALIYKRFYFAIIALLLFKVVSIANAVLVFNKALLLYAKDDGDETEIAHFVSLMIACYILMRSIKKDVFATIVKNISHLEFSFPIDLVTLCILVVVHKLLATSSHFVMIAVVKELLVFVIEAGLRFESKMYMEKTIKMLNDNKASAILTLYDTITNDWFLARIMDLYDLSLTAKASDIVRAGTKVNKFISWAKTGELQKNVSVYIHYAVDIVGIFVGYCFLAENVIQTIQVCGIVLFVFCFVMPSVYHSSEIQIVTQTRMNILNNVQIGVNIAIGTAVGSRLLNSIMRW